MTVYESIVTWLGSILSELQNEFPHPFSIIEPDRIPLPNDYNQTDFQAGGLFSSPNDMTTTLMGGQVKHTDFKSFYLRRPFKLVDSRKENENFFEKLTKKIHERNMDCDMPKDGRQWKEITVNSGVYPAQRDSGELWADYLVNLRLVYIE